MRKFFLFGIAASLVALLFASDALIGQQGRIVKVFDSRDLPSSLTTLVGKRDTLHMTTGGYTRGFVQNLATLGGDSLYFHVIVDTLGGAFTAGAPPKVILEGRAAMDSITGPRFNRYGYYDRFANNPWTLVSFCSTGTDAVRGKIDTLFTGAFSMRNINKTGKMEYRFRIVPSDSGQSTSRQVNVRWQIFGIRPW